MNKYIVQDRDQVYIDDDEVVYVTEYEYMVKDGEVIAYPTGHTEDVNEAARIPYHEALEVAKLCQGLVFSEDCLSEAEYEYGAYIDKRGIIHIFGKEMPDGEWEDISNIDDELYLKNEVQDRKTNTDMFLPNEQVECFEGQLDYYKQEPSPKKFVYRRQMIIERIKNMIKGWFSK